MLSPSEIKKLEKLAKVGDIGIAEELNALESRLEGLEAIVPVLREAVDGEKGEDGHDGKDGQDYILTEQDKTEIAQSITVPIVEKLIEKTETIIKEVPIVTNEIVEVAVINPDELPQYAEKYRDGLELLQGDNRLDVSAIKGIDDRERKMSDALTERAISIVDNRTSFLINKVGNISTTINTVISGTWSYLATTWSLAPTLNASITGGDVYNYTLNGVTRYRFVPTTYDATQDAFYSEFSNPTLSGLIVTRG